MGHRSCKRALALTACFNIGLSALPFDTQGTHLPRTRISYGKKITTNFMNPKLFQSLYLPKLLSPVIYKIQKNL